MSKSKSMSTSKARHDDWSGQQTSDIHSLQATFTLPVTTPPSAFSYCPIPSCPIAGGPRTGSPAARQSIILCHWPMLPSSDHQGTPVNQIKHIPQDLYNSILKNVPIACVDIALIAQGRVLLVKRRDAPAKGAWWVPGGRVLKGEMMRDTALRKAREEVGIECHVGPIVHTAETIFPDGPSGIPVHSINSCFFVYPVDPSFGPKLDDHHDEFKWVDRIAGDLHPYVKRCLMGAGLFEE
jgi:colanic acid biosynthesis protein WcaH